MASDRLPLRLTAQHVSAATSDVDIDEMVSALTAKKRELKARDQQVELEVLLDFLRNTKTEKEEVSRTRELDKYS